MSYLGAAGSETALRPARELIQATREAVDGGPVRPPPPPPEYLVTDLELPPLPQVEPTALVQQPIVSGPPPVVLPPVVSPTRAGFDFGNLPDWVLPVAGVAAFWFFGRKGKGTY